MFRLLFQSAFTALILALVAVPTVIAPTPVTVTDVPFPTVGPDSVAVSLVATITADGRVSNMRRVDIAGSTAGGARYAGTLAGYEQNSVDALKTWKFAPALDPSSGKPVPAPASVTFLYQRAMGYERLPDLNRDAHAADDFQPPILTRAHPLPEYPWNSIGVGAVVLVLDVREDGSVGAVKNIRSVASLDEPSLKAVRSWTFAPARYLGKPVRSTTTVAVVYLYRINSE